LFYHFFNILHYRRSLVLSRLEKLSGRIVKSNRTYSQGNREQGTGNREQGTGNREQGDSSLEREEIEIRAPSGERVTPLALSVSSFYPLKGMGIYPFFIPYSLFPVSCSLFPVPRSL
jgi:hypothetical protein